MFLCSVSKEKPGGVAAFTCTPELSSWMRWVISESLSLGEVFISGLEETSWSRERTARAAFSQGSILLLCAGLAGAPLPRCWAQHGFYRAEKDQHLHGLPNIGVFLC